MVFKRLIVKGSRILKMSMSTSTGNRPFTVTVEGNIGSGKTTFLKHFENQDNVAVLSEPVEMWRDCKGQNLLALMYDDPQKWSFTFQSYVQLTMLRNHMKRPKQPVKLMERSLYSARYCFVEKVARDGILEPPAFAVIDEWFKWLCKQQDVAVDLIVYLRTTPEVVYQRMLERNRSEEKHVPIDYLRSLHEYHEQWLYHKTLFSCPAPVLVIDGDVDLSTIKDEYGKCESQILERAVST